MSKAPTQKKPAKAKPIKDRAKVPSERPGQPGGRRDTNRKERTKALADAALSLFLVRGIEAVTIEDITTQARVAKGSFYRYFDDKTALVESLFAPVAEATIQTFDESMEALRRAKTKEEALASYDVIGNGLGKLFLEHGDVVQLYLAESKGPLEGARGPARRLANVVTEKAIAHTKLAHEKGLLRPFPPEISSLVVIGACERMLHAVLIGDPIGEPWEIPGHVVNLILDGIRAP
jgi:AcrR family transcriptional regulator